jgi:hypothetical protein
VVLMQRNTLNSGVQEALTGLLCECIPFDVLRRIIATSRKSYYAKKLAHKKDPLYQARNEALRHNSLRKLASSSEVKAALFEFFLDNSSPVAFYTREVSVPGSDETIKFPCLISHMQASKHYIDYLASIPSKLRVCRTLFFIYFNYFFDDRQRARGGLSNAVVDDDFNNFELLNSLISRLKQNVPKDLQV